MVPDLQRDHPSDPAKAAQRGAIAAFTSYFLWGIFPIYWKQLDGISAVELMAHRVAWTLVAVLIFLSTTGRLGMLWRAWGDPANRKAHLINSAALMTNWGTFVWAVGHGRIIEASLGYFLVPLLNAGLGRLVFQERLRRLQHIALGFAILGCSIMVAQTGGLPWVALLIAGSWTTYGFVRKRSHAGPFEGLTMEMLYALPIAVGYLVGLHLHGGGAFGFEAPRSSLLMIGTGAISTVPLVLFAYGARRLRFTTLGLLQYLAPTGQFLIGWLCYHEPFAPVRAGGFIAIWIGLACYSYDTLRANQATNAVTAPESSAS